MTKNNRAKQLRREHAEKNNLTYAEAKRVATFPDRTQELGIKRWTNIKEVVGTRAMQAVYAIVECLEGTFNESLPFAYFDNYKYCRFLVKRYNDGSELYIDCEALRKNDDGEFSNTGGFADISVRVKLPNGSVCEFCDEGTIWKNQNGATCHYTPLFVDDDRSGESEAYLTQQICDDVTFYFNATVSIYNEAQYRIVNSGSALEITFDFQEDFHEIEDGTQFTAVRPIK